MLFLRRVAIISLATGVSACGAQEPKDEALNPLVIAEQYARQHYPEAQVPKGLARQWFVEDHGDIWIVEFGSQGALGGSIRMAITKQDGKVTGSELTQ